MSETLVASPGYFMFPNTHGLLPGPTGVFSGRRPSLSAAYIWKPSPNCLRLFMQLICLPFAFAEESVGRSKAARIMMIEMTTKISSNVKARCEEQGQPVRRNPARPLRGRFFPAWYASRVRGNALGDEGKY